MSSEPFVPASPSTPASSEELYEAFRRDLKSVRKDVIHELEGVRADMNGGFERQAGSIMVLYKLTTERLDSLERHLEQRAREAAIIQGKRDVAEAEFRRAVLGYLEPDRKNVTITNHDAEANVFRWSFRAIRRVAHAFGTDFETTRLVLVFAVIATLAAITLTACTMHASELLK